MVLRQVEQLQGCPPEGLHAAIMPKPTRGGMDRAEPTPAMAPTATGEWGPARNPTFRGVAPCRLGRLESRGYGLSSARRLPPRSASVSRLTRRLGHSTGLPVCEGPTDERPVSLDETQRSGVHVAHHVTDTFACLRRRPRGRCSPRPTRSF